MELPQVENTSRLIKQLEENGVLVTLETIDPFDLSWNQYEVDQDTVDKIKKDIEDTESLSPSIVDENYGILDGHHRNEACRQYAEEQEITVKQPIVRVDLGFEDAVQQIHDVLEGLDDISVFYVGSFQPFHKKHFKNYNSLVDRFGVSNVNCVTSDNTNDVSPFTFNSKVSIISSLYPIPDNKIISSDTVIPNEDQINVYAFDTDSEFRQLSSALLPNIAMKSFHESENIKSGESYYYIVGNDTNLHRKSPSGTHVSRSDMRYVYTTRSIPVQKEFFKQVFGTFNEDVFEKVSSSYKKEIVDEDLEHIVLERMGPSVLRIIKDFRQMIRETPGDPTNVIQEATQTGAFPADDGPATFWNNDEYFEQYNIELAQRMGYEFVRRLGDRSDQQLRSALSVNSMFPAGADHDTPVDNPDAAHKEFMDILGQMLGYEIIDYLGADEGDTPGPDPMVQDIADRYPRPLFDMPRDDPYNPSTYSEDGPNDDILGT